MRWMFALVWVTLTTASTIRYTPTKVLLAKLQGAVLDTKDQAPANTQYHEQNSDGFYSYGYSAGRSAKAEYLTLDGSSKGFYSYIDADGKLQTVKYEAGGSHGFKAAATNLPKAPKNPNRIGPLPVRDTPEVQEAKKAHFEAIREAELREVLASQNEAIRYEETSAEEQQKSERPQQERPQQEVADILENTRSKILAILSESSSSANANAATSASSSAENNHNLNGAGDGDGGEGGGASGSREEFRIEMTQDKEEGVERGVDEDNSGLLSIDSLQISNDEGEINEAESNRDSEDGITIGNTEEKNQATSAGDTSREFSNADRQMTSYKTKDSFGSDEQQNTRAYYTFESEGEREGGESGISSKDLLRLTESQDSSDYSLAQKKSTKIETVHVPVHSYYTVIAPNNKYTVVTPTTHHLVQREEARKRGHSLPISLSSSYVSHRLRSK